jgi:hypothetical protein
MFRLGIVILLVIGVALTFCEAGLRAASHSDAPLIKQDPQANITDVYAFVGTKYNDTSQKVLNVVVHVRPFSVPGDGVIYDRFADDAIYSIHIANPSTGATVGRYDFTFSSSYAGAKNPNTILSYGLGTETGPIQNVGDARQNYTQVFRVRKNNTLIGDNLLTPPPNVGSRTTPHYNDPATGNALSGATSFDGLDRYTQQAIHNLNTGEVVFAGPREDGFYADTPGIFDLLDPRILNNDGDSTDGLGQDGNGVDAFQGFNVLAYAIQIPVSSLPASTYSAPFADLANPLPATGPANGVGVYANVWRAQTTTRRTDGSSMSSGSAISVNRMGNPLFNEVLVALRDKDNYNRTFPPDDPARFKSYAENPEVAFLINFVFGTNIATTGRSDLAAVYIPDVIRVDTTTPPVRQAGEQGFSRFGFIGGDTTTDSAGRVKSSGWPNGRRLGDDVVDIALTAVASGPSYNTITVVGDNVDANDQVYNRTFPYSATPHNGTSKPDCPPGSQQ